MDSIGRDEEVIEFIDNSKKIGDKDIDVDGDSTHLMRLVMVTFS